MCLGAEGALNRGCKYNIFSKNMCFLLPPPTVIASPPLHAPSSDVSCHTRSPCKREQLGRHPSGLGSLEGCEVLRDSRGDHPWYCLCWWGKPRRRSLGSGRSSWRSQPWDHLKRWELRRRKRCHYWQTGNCWTCCDGAGGACAVGGPAVAWVDGV